MAVYNSIQLDLCKKNSYKAIPTKQLDTNSRFLRVELLNNGNSYDFNDDVTVILASTRNGETKAYKCTVEDGCVIAPLTSWMLAEEGYVDCEIVLIDTASNSKLSSFAFSICVDESIYNDETISQDENYNVLLQLITDVDTAVKSCNTATEKATEIYNTVETKLNNGELKGEKGDKGDPYELTISDIWKIVDNIPYASVQTAGILRVPGGCGLHVDKRGNANVYYNIPDLTSTTDDIIVEKQGGTLQGDGYCKLTFNSEKYAQKTEVPTKTSELENDSNFVSDANYIHTDNNFTNEEKTKLENDVATKDYVEQEIATFDFIKIVEALPEQGLPNRTYFVPKTDQQTNDLYDEYMWVNNKWEFVGTRQIEVDLTNYVKNTDFATSTKAGVVKVGNYNGLYINPSTGTVTVAGSPPSFYKSGLSNSAPVTASLQDIAAFYGLAKASGDTTQSKSSNAVGNYTDEAKTKIQNMLGVQPKFELGNGLQLVDGVLSLDIPVATASTTYGGDVQ